MENILWLVTSEHLKNRLWFKDDEDFKAGMNYVALLASTQPAQIMAFVLMSNHVHFVVGGSKKDALGFVTRFKKLYSQYYRSKYSFKQLLRGNGVNIKELSVGDESFEKAVAYVQMNPVAANICVHPSGYPWGTGSTFFSDRQHSGKFFSDLSQADRKHMLHSKRKLPPQYAVDGRGVISPFSYIDVNFVESVFRTPKRMSYFLSKSSKARTVAKLPTFSDKTILMAVKELCISMYNKPDLSFLEDPQRADILRQIQYRFSADPNQIARVVGIPYATVATLIDSF
ncbi:MAG: hypothetical protein IK041_02385 [Bacteroidales bacterium]|nr:hypothetical protein [Bacteroidales bacterium]